MATNSYATKECLYCGRTNRADSMQCAGCGAGSFSPIQIVVVPRAYVEATPQIPLAPVQQVAPALRIVYFLLFGFPVGFYWCAFSLLVMATVLGYPLGRALMRLLPAIATLQREREPFGFVLGQGWQATIAGFKTAPLWGKILSLLVIGVYVVALSLYFAR